MKKKFISVFLVFLLLLGVLAVVYHFSPAVSHAENIFTDFSDFALRAIPAAGENGWTANSTIDQEIVDQFIQPASTSANRSLRISNGASAIDGYVMSEPLTNQAGETGASDSGNFTSGLMQPHFEAEWDFASANPSVYQSNLTIYASAERGGDVIPTGGFSYSMARVYMGDCSAGVCSLQDLAAIRPSVDGLIVIYGDPHAFPATTTVAQGLDRTVPHHVRLTIDFKDGPDNDVVSVCVDKLPCVNNLPSGEGWNRSNNGNTQVVRTIAFTQAGYSPASLNQGFYLDNFTMMSSGNEPTATLSPTPTIVPTTVPGSPSPTPKPIPSPKDKQDCKKDGWIRFNRPAFKNQGQCVKYIEWYDIKRFEKGWAKWEDFRDKYADVTL